jgi:hypothetical protein
LSKKEEFEIQSSILTNYDIDLKEQVAELRENLAQKAVLITKTQIEVQTV